MIYLKIKKYQQKKKRSKMPEIIDGEQEKSEIRLPGQVYFVESDVDSSVLVGMDVFYNKQNKNVTWFDTVKERGMHYDQITVNLPEGFSFTRAKSEGGGNYSMAPMTTEIYDAKVKPKLISPKEIKTQEELIAAFEETKKNAW